MDTCLLNEWKKNDERNGGEETDKRGLRGD